MEPRAPAPRLASRAGGRPVLSERTRVRGGGGCAAAAAGAELSRRVGRDVRQAGVGSFGRELEATRRVPAVISQAAGACRGHSPLPPPPWPGSGLPAQTPAPVMRPLRLHERTLDGGSTGGTVTYLGLTVDGDNPPQGLHDAPWRRYFWATPLPEGPTRDLNDGTPQGDTSRDRESLGKTQ